MHRLAAGILGALCVALPAAAQSPAKAIYAEGRMLVLVPPEFPKEALARGQSGQVTVSGTIRTDGGLANIRLEAKPSNEHFESAVMDVAPLWRLQPRIVSPSCLATEAEAQVIIWFEIVGGKPKVSFTPSKPRAGTAAPEIFSDRKPVRFTPPEYPPERVADPKTPKEILQIVYLSVAEDGVVTGVTVAPLLYYRDFEPYISAAARQWKFAPQPKRWCGEIELRFGLE